MGGELQRKATARRILIVGNYSRTNQHSQRLYAQFVTELARKVLGSDAVDTWSQKGFFAQFPWPAPLMKLALDLDRYVLAPFECIGLSADIVFIADNSNAWYAPFIKRKTTLVGCHDLLAYVAANEQVIGWKPSLPTRLVMRANIAAMRAADLVVSVSGVTAGVLRELGVYRTHVIHHCQLQDFPASEPIGELDEGALARTFLHMGAGKFAKNSGLVIAAFDRLCDTDDVRLLLVGGQADRLRSTSRFPDRIVSLRTLRPGQLRHVYERCGALVMPSRYEGFGLPIIEAQGLGCPAIASDGGALNEVMFDGPLKLPQPVAAEDLATTMQRVIRDIDFRRDMIEQGRQNSARFDRARTAEAYEVLFRQLAGDDQRSL